MNAEELDKKVKQVVHSLAYEKGFVSSIDILIRLNYLSMADYESWRFGKVEYLEKVCKANLRKLQFINKTIRKNAIELKLESSLTSYHKFGKGENRKLIFSKSRDPKIEDAYAIHYLDKKRILELKSNKARV